MLTPVSFNKLVTVSKHQIKTKIVKKSTNSNSSEGGLYKMKHIASTMIQNFEVSMSNSKKKNIKKIK